MQSILSLCLFVPESVAHKLASILDGDRYQSFSFHETTVFKEFLEHDPEHIDCLIVFAEPSVYPILNSLYEKGRLLPTVLLESPPSTEEDWEAPRPTLAYHHAEVRLPESKWQSLSTVIDRAIADYLHLEPSCAIPKNAGANQPLSVQESQQSFLLLQQRRLADKLKERLGYLGVYYKRNSSHFFRNLSPQEKQEFLELINVRYQEIILNYFNNESDVNELLDQFVNQAFFADLPISKILETHMELMDELAKHLKLEGRNEDILLDYRLVLIDILAHLSEMYRRSIPREDLPCEVHSQTD